MKNTNYELMYILSPKLSAEELKSSRENLEKNFSKITKTDVWGLKEFKYTIKTFKEGYYVVLEGNIDAKGIEEIKHLFKINKNYIRFMLINLDKENRKENPPIPPRKEPDERSYYSRQKKTFIERNPVDKSKKIITKESNPTAKSMPESEENA